MASFGDVLLRLRKEKGLTRKDIARISGVSERAVEYWEKKNKEPGFYKVRLIAHHLNEPITRFVTDETVEEYAKRLGEGKISDSHIQYKTKFP